MVKFGTDEKSPPCGTDGKGEDHCNWRQWTRTIVDGPKRWRSSGGKIINHKTPLLRTDTVGGDTTNSLPLTDKDSKENVYPQP